jgi:DNA mismatch endonuclease (patch repair protein)
MPKFEATKLRDRAAVSQLEASGWKVLTIWECETNDPAQLNARLSTFLESASLLPESEADPV